MTITELRDAVLADPPFFDSYERLVEEDGDPARPDYRWFAKLVRRLRPKFVIELGTGRGRTAAQIAAALHEFSFFATINWPNPPSGDDVGAELAPWRGSNRIVQVLGDTREQAWRFPDGAVDLLYIDSTHTCECASAEWALYRPKLADGAVVVVDDIDHGDMRRFWDALPYDKVELRCGAAGMFCYREGML
jgi:predicted O-methyltransferase YrrM